MAIKILMPALSPTMKEGNLLSWLKKEGDTVEPGDILAEIETDKATMEVEAVDEGTLGKILIEAGTEDVKVNTPIAVLLEDGDDKNAIDDVLKDDGSAATAPQKEETTPDTKQVDPVPVIPESEPAPTTKENHIFASPLAKRIAAQQNVDLTSLQGSGPRGRIVKADVEAATKSGAPRATTTPGQPATYKDTAISSMRKSIARRLSEAKQEVPHFYITSRVNIDSVLDIRAQLNEGRQSADKISVNDFAIKALAMALHDVPEVNVSWQGDTLRQYSGVDVSVAVAIKGGLMTPIIFGAHSTPLESISAQVKTLARKAKNGELKPHEFQGGTVSISNLGMFGVENFQAIINPPQAAILAIGKGEETVVTQDGEIGIATLMHATLSVDHRAIDGADAARALSRFKFYMEHPAKMLL